MMKTLTCTFTIIHTGPTRKTEGEKHKKIDTGEIRTHAPEGTTS